MAVTIKGLGEGGTKEGTINQTNSPYEEERDVKQKSRNDELVCSLIITLPTNALIVCHLF